MFFIGQTLRTQSVDKQIELITLNVVFMATQTTPRRSPRPPNSSTVEIALLHHQGTLVLLHQVGGSRLNNHLVNNHATVLFSAGTSASLSINLQTVERNVATPTDVRLVDASKDKPPSAVEAMQKSSIK